MYETGALSLSCVTHRYKINTEGGLALIYSRAGNLYQLFFCLSACCNVVGEYKKHPEGGYKNLRFLYCGCKTIKKRKWQTFVFDIVVLYNRFTMIKMNETDFYNGKSFRIYLSCRQV